MWVQIVPSEGAIFGGKDMPVHARGQFAVSCAEMAEPTEMPFGLCGLWAQGSMCYMRSHWRHLAITIEKSVCGGGAAFLPNYVDHLFNGPFMHGGTKCTLGGNFADIFSPIASKL